MNNFAPTNNPEDVEEMKKFRMIMEGNAETISEATKKVPAQNFNTPQPNKNMVVDAINSGSSALMRDILENFYNAGGNTLTESETPPAPSMPVTDEYGYDVEGMDYIDPSIYLNTETSNSPETNTVPSLLMPSPSNTKYMVASFIESEKDTNTRFEVVASNRATVIPGIKSKSVAVAIMKYLNSGKSPKSSQVEELVDLDTKYYQNKTELDLLAKRHSRCVELKEMDAAAVFKKRFETVKAETLIIRDKIKSILGSI